MSLSVAYCEGLTAEGLAFLEPLTQMQILDISGLAITDSSLSCLSKLREMIALDISYCEQITDAGLAHLSALTKLESLTLDDTQVTDQGVETLQMYLPNCVIE